MRLVVPLLLEGDPMPLSPTEYKDAVLAAVALLREDPYDNVTKLMLADLMEEQLGDAVIERTTKYLRKGFMVLNSLDKKAISCLYRALNTATLEDEPLAEEGRDETIESIAFLADLKIVNFLLGRYVSWRRDGILVLPERTVDHSILPSHYDDLWRLVWKYRERLKYCAGNSNNEWNDVLLEGGRVAYAKELKAQSLREKMLGEFEVKDQSLRLKQEEKVA